jgi:hypothetical protein
MSTPAETGLARWHEVFRSRDPARVAGLVADGAVFRSPAVHRPQEGGALVAAYLEAAMVVLGGDAFTYVDEWVRERDAILEFRSQVDGLEVQGIDRITWDDDGQITEFTVLVRPLRALHALVERMGEQLARGSVGHNRE